MVIPKRPFFRQILILGLAAAVWGSTGWAEVHPPASAEYAVKAAFLYNFAKFVKWPSEIVQNQEDTFVIGILGKDPFGKDLEDRFTGKLIQDKKLTFIQLSNIQQAANCQVLFISRSEDSRLETLLSTLEKNAVLTVSDVDRFVTRGGMIGFLIDENKIRFNINLAAADKAGLKISSQLSVLAKTIKGKPSQGEE